jgi:hypothetical protein
MSSMMMERSGMAMPGMGMPGMGTPAMGAPATTPTPNYMMVPRCTIKMEKCNGGMKIHMGMCKCDMTKDGVCITCTSGDPKCCEMIQACCECMSCMMKDGCTCCVMMNNMPVCCGCC